MIERMMRNSKSSMKVIMVGIRDIDWIRKLYGKMECTIQNLNPYETKREFLFAVMVSIVLLTQFLSENPVWSSVYAHAATLILSWIILDILRREDYKDK